MSLAMKVGHYNAVARAGSMGDPGLFGFLGKALGGIAKVAGGALGGLVTGGPLGAIAGGIGATGLLGSGSRSTMVIQTPRPGVTMTSGTIPRAPLVMPGGASPPLLPASVFPVSIGGPRGISIGTPSLPQVTTLGGQPFGSGGVVHPMGTGGGALLGAGAGTPCMRGYHYNKTGYYTKRYGFIEPGSVCVRNRRRNPLNPRALSRAMARLSSAKKATECLSRYTIRAPKNCGCK